MRSLLIFLLVFIAALFLGALLTYPLHLLLSPFFTYEYNDLTIPTTQLTGLVFSLCYLHYSDRLALDTLGLKTQPGKPLTDFGYGLLSGLLILAVLAIALYGLGIYGTNQFHEFTTGPVVTALLTGLLSGIAVGLFEETLFRGALLQGLGKQAGMNNAVLIISLLYAAVHFIDYPKTDTAMSINWLTAPGQFLPAYANVFSTTTLDAFLSLFMLGLLLAFVRIHKGNIIQCIGLHAGLVTGIKLFRFFAEYKPDNSWAFLVSRYDFRLGWLALLWLTLVTAAYFIYLHRRPAK